MFSQKFTVSSASLELLKVGEKGVIASLRNANETKLQQVREMGIRPGVLITIEQCFPEFVVKAGETQITLEKEIVRSIYVRTL